MSYPATDTYVILLFKLRDFTPEVIESHVAHLKKLDDEDKLVLCGPFRDYPGGMVAVRATGKEEAVRIAESDPFVREGFERYEIRTLEVSCRENNYLLE